MISLNPYVVYHGNCEEAFVFYKDVFRGADLYITRYADAPAEAKQFFINAPGKSVMHATLKIDENTVIMGNDNADPLTQLGEGVLRGFYLFITVDDPKEADRIFNGLSAGGVVIMPIAQTFWSQLYGVLTDRFGINWKITVH